MGHQDRRNGLAGQFFKDPAAEPGAQAGIQALTVLASRWHLLAGLGRHTLAIYLLHLPVQALLVELGLYDLMRGKATIVVVLWSVLLAAVTLAVLNLSPVQRACDAVANCWYKRK